jgi:hypothetical protein
MTTIPGSMSIIGGIIAPHHIAAPASQAYHRLLGGRGAAADLVTYRTWITWLRLHGSSEAGVIHAVEAADKFARELGIP